MKAAIVFMFVLVDSSTSTLVTGTAYPSYADCFAALRLMRIENSDGAMNGAPWWPPKPKKGGKK